MGDGDAHRFRFFVAAVGLEAGALARLEPVDVHHLRVLRLEEGSVVDVVDGDGLTWEAQVAPGEGVVRLVAAHADQRSEPRIELVAGVLVGGRFDDLVDGAVQAGVARIVPFAASTKEAARIEARRERLERIVLAAAKQSQRSLVPVIAEPVDTTALRAMEPGIIVDPGAPLQLADAITAAADSPIVRLLVGASDGLAPSLVLDLAGRGWVRGRIGPTILRSELAAPVAVAIAAMRVS